MNNEQQFLNIFDIHPKTHEELCEYEERRINNLLKEMFQCAKNEQWERLSDLMFLNQDFYGWSFPLFYYRLPDQYKREAAVNAFSGYGSVLPCVRMAIRNLPKFSKCVLPPEIEEKKTLIVYRGGEEPINKAKYRHSWTTKIETAEWYFRRLKIFQKKERHLYRGMIQTKDIITYNNNRNECEVLQYRKVYDITDITPSIDE